MIFIERGGHVVGTTLVNPNGERVTVKKPYGHHWVNYGGERVLRYGYVCEKVETGESYFYEAGQLEDEDGFITHLRLVKD